MNKKQDSFLYNIIRGVNKRLQAVSSDKNKKAELNWFKIKKLKHLPYNQPGRYPFMGSVIHFNNGQELLHSLQEIFVEDIYNIDFTSNRPYIIDCGSNIGLSVLYLKKRYPSARIVAFEPDASNFKTLKENVTAYNLSDVELRNEAIWKENTTLKFVSDGTLGSKLSAQDNTSNIVNVKATRLKDLLSQKVDFLKMDIEGAEFEVLKDCQEKLHLVDYLFIEYHGYFNKINELTEVFQIIEKSGHVYYIKEASNVFPTPFNRGSGDKPYDIQLNIFCFRINE